MTVINLKDIDFSFFEKLKTKYSGKNINVIFDEAPIEPINQKEIFKELLALQKKYPPFIVSKDINLSDLANEVNL